LGFRFILSSRGFVCTMRLGFATCIPTQSFSSPPLFISAKPLVDLLHISISFVTCSVSGRRGPRGSQIADKVYLTLCDGMKSEYLSCPWNTSVREWYKKWFLHPRRAQHRHPL
jgi:hypothetical protein